MSSDPASIDDTSSLPKHRQIKDVIAYLKTRPVGSKCCMTGGTRNSKKLPGEFLQRGMRITRKGPHGNRVITFVELDNTLVENTKIVRSSGRSTDQYLIGNVRRSGIPASKPTYLQGNYDNLRVRLKKYVGLGNFTIARAVDDPRGKGWMVTLKVPLSP